MSKFMDLFYESVMTPTPTPYAPNGGNSEQPQTIFVIFNEDKESLLSKRGVITTSFCSQSALSNYASNLYGLLKGAKEVYSIIPEVYTQAITKLDDKEYYKFIKDNGVKHENLFDAKAEDKVFEDSLADDPDFIIDNEPGGEVKTESVVHIRRAKK